MLASLPGVRHVLQARLLQVRQHQVCMLSAALPHWLRVTLCLAAYLHERFVLCEECCVVLSLLGVSSVVLLSRSLLQHLHLRSQTTRSIVLSTCARASSIPSK